MKHTTILALDPSGSFNEGKGTTGWALFDTGIDKVITTDYIAASKYATLRDYWKAHIDLIKNVSEDYPNLVVVMEDYLLYESKMKAQINSRMETPKLIGVLQYYMLLNNIACRFQTAGEVKNRWTDKILVHKKIFVPKGKGHCLYDYRNNIINRHCKDAVRHAIHYKTFKNK